VNKMYYDFHVHEDFQLAYESMRLGFNGIALIQHSDKFNPNYLENIKGIKDDFLLLSGVEIYAKNPEDLRKKVQKFRAKADVLIVNGGNIKINRAACEDPRVDILANPYKNRRDSGINHIIAKKAAENKVALEIGLNQIIKTRSSVRAKILSNFRQIIKLKHKFKFPLITTSNAHSIYDLRTPEDIITLLSCLGMDSQEAKNSLSKYPLDIIERSKIRENIVVKGVRIVE